ncbi:MAG: DUF2318 domain-containing protein [Anaerolineae bacterium]|nr:DUF2318 domain-containing protein [Anaerolineae bacterium]
MKHEQDRTLREGKRAKFTQPAKKAKPALGRWLLAGGGLLAILLLAWFWPGSGAESAGSTVQAGELPVSDGAVRLPVTTFDDGQARFYTHHADGKDIQFFVLKSSDGVIRAAFNACDVCFLDKKGYRQEGDEMVCNNCGQRFPSELINEVRGGCNPSPLVRTIEGDEVVIRVDDILSGARYF